MINNILLTVPSEHVPFVDGSNKFDWGNGAIVAVVSILIVFLILALVIFITHFLFKGIDKRSQKKTLQLPEEEVQKAVKSKVVTDIYNYVKIRIEMGIFEPIELTDVYSLDIYIGIQLLNNNLTILLTKI